MKISRRKTISILASASFIPVFLGRCKTSHKIAQSNSEIEKKEVYKIDKNKTITNQNGFKIISLEGSKGICKYSNSGKIKTICMQIMSPDGKLTITDQSWNTYNIDGQIKRWKFDEIEWISDPLINYTFSNAYTKKDVSIEIAFFNPENPYYPTRIFQQLIQLG